MLDILIVLTITVVLLAVSPIIAIHSVYKAHKKKRGK
jgi:hypothetical protein